jgi:hypothetical protein
MKTHGGRSFLHGHMLGDNVHEFLAPCIYEGEGEMLGMAFFKSLVKQHGVRFFEPIGKSMQAAGIKKPNPLNPLHIWAMKGAILPYAKWYLGQKLRPKARPALPTMPRRLREHADFACDRLQRSPLQISKTMSKHQLKLADRQCRISAMSQDVQDLLTMVCITLYAARQDDEVIQAAADIACSELTHRITGSKPSDQYFRRVTELGTVIADGGFQSIAGVDAGEILMPYEN